MKKLFILLGVLFTTQITTAQDVLVTNDGDALKVWGIEVSNSAVFYRETEAQDAPIKRLDKKDVLMIKYQDGRKTIIGEGNEKTSSPTRQINSVGDTNANTEFINSVKNNRVEYVGAASSSDAGMLFCQYFPKNGSNMADQNASFSVVTEAQGYFNGNKQQPLAGEMCLYLVVKNRTPRTMYIDLGNTFLIHGGQSFAYYVPTMTSHTSGTSSSVGVSMGAVAGALGVSGPLGTLANGVGVGLGSSQSTTTTVMSQRVIAIPPMAEKKIDTPMTLFPKENTELFSEDFRYAGLYKDLTLFVDKNAMLKEGESRDIDENFSIGSFGIVVTYASDENISHPQVLNADYSVQRIVGTKSGRKLDMKFFNVEYISNNYKSTAYFFARQRKK